MGGPLQLQAPAAVPSALAGAEHPSRTAAVDGPQPQMAQQAQQQVGLQVPQPQNTQKQPAAAPVQQQPQQLLQPPPWLLNPASQAQVVQQAQVQAVATTGAGAVSGTTEGQGQHTTGGPPAESNS